MEFCTTFVGHIPESTKDIRKPFVHAANSNDSKLNIDIDYLCYDDA